MAGVNLTKDAVSIMCRKAKDLRPQTGYTKPMVVQVLDLHEFAFNRRYTVTLSDGDHRKLFFLASKSNEFVINGRLQRGSVLRLNRYSCYGALNDHVCIFVNDLDLLLEKCDLIGKPTQFRGIPTTQVAGSFTTEQSSTERPTVAAGSVQVNFRGPELVTKLDEVYSARGLGDATKLGGLYRDLATGARAWAPSSGNVSPFYDELEKGSHSNPHNENGNQQATKSTTIRTVGSKRVANNQGRNGKKLNATCMLYKKLDRICNVVTERKSSTDLPGCSIKEVIDYMGGMAECAPLSDTYMSGTELFVKRVNREMFMALPNDEVRLEWLKRGQMQKKHI